MSRALVLDTETSEFLTVAESFADHGLELSRQRAQAVATALGQMPGKSVAVKGLAEADPVAPNTTEQGRAQNRRVEIRYRPA